MNILSRDKDLWYVTFCQCILLLFSVYVTLFIILFCFMFRCGLKIIRRSCQV